MSSRKSNARAITVELIMFFTYAFFAVNWIAGTTLTTEIMEFFHLESYASATLISNAITVAKIIGNFLAAWFLVKLLPKKAIGFASFLIVAGCAMAVFAQQYAMFIIGRFVMGFGGALYVVYFSPMVVHYFSPEQRPAVNAANGVAYNLGSIIALIIVAPIIHWLQTWQYSMAFFAAISLVLFILWLIAGEDFPINQTTANDKTDNGSFIEDLKKPFNWIFPFTYSGLLMLYIVVLTMFPQAQLSNVNSSTLSTLMAVGGIIGSLLAIALSKKYSKRLPVIRLCGIVMTVMAFVMFNVTIPFVSYLSALLLGILMFLPVTSLVSIPQELSGMTPEKITRTMGLFWAISYIIETIVYFLLGKVVEAQGGSFQGALNIAAVLSLTFFIGSFLLPETRKDG